MSKDKEMKLWDLIPDNANANDGTERGRDMLRHSFEEFGAGRSVLLDKNNRIIAGNKSVSTAMEVGLEDVIVVETDGDTIVAVKRTDVELDSKDGRGLAIADNATSEANLLWNESALRYINQKYGADARHWGADIPDWDADVYKPNVNPIASHEQVGNADIERAKDKIESQIENRKQAKDLFEVCCPDCGYKFEIRKY